MESVLSGVGDTFYGTAYQFIDSLTATAFAVAVVLHQKTAVKLHSGFYSYLLFINRAFKP